MVPFRLSAVLLALGAPLVTAARPDSLITESGISDVAQQFVLLDDLLFEDEEDQHMQASCAPRPVPPPPFVFFAKMPGVYMNWQCLLSTTRWFSALWEHDPQYLRLYSSALSLSPVFVEATLPVVPLYS